MRCRRRPRTGFAVRVLYIFFLSLGSAAASPGPVAGVVSSATPEATAAGVGILESGGNAVDAAIAVSLALGVSEPAGSGIGGQTVMLIKRREKPAQVVHGTTWSPAALPEGATDEELASGRSASTVPSALRVLDVAHRGFGSGRFDWTSLVAPAIAIAEDGFVVGAFRQRSFRAYADRLRQDPRTAGVFLLPGGRIPQVGDRLRQPLLAATLRRIADHGAMEFYTGRMAREIADDMAENGGWITSDDLRDFPEPRVVPAIAAEYRGYTVETLPPPFGGWAALQALELLEQEPPAILASDDSDRRLALLDALRIAHASRRNDPVTDYTDFAADVAERLAPVTIRRLADERGGETTHFTVVDGEGTVVAVTQSIDSYFGAAVAHPTLGFLYNNYMQGFQVDDPDAPYFLEARQMPLSSMSAAVVSRDDETLLGLGSPGSARIISAVAQVTSHWIDVGAGIETAVAAYRVHALPDARAYVEGSELDPHLLSGLAKRGLTLVRPTYGVSDSQLDPYFGGVHAVAYENGRWTGAADPRRDGTVGIARPAK